MYPMTGANKIKMNKPFYGQHYKLREYFIFQRFAKSNHKKILQVIKKNLIPARLQYLNLINRIPVSYI